MPKWIKGQSGNPKGRVRGRVSMAEELRALLNTRDESGMILGERILRTLAAVSISGNVDAIKVVFDRMDGKVPEIIQVAGKLPPIEFVRHDAGQGDSAADGDAGPVGESK